jgi:hypothetical protein
MSVDDGGDEDEDCNLVASLMATGCGSHVGERHTDGLL